MAIIVFISTILCMMVSLVFFPKIKIFKTSINTHWLIVLVGAVFMLIFKLVNFDDLMNLLFSNQEMNPLKLVVLFIFLTIMSLFLDEVGLFKWLAYKLLAKANGTQWKIFIPLYALTSILTIFTSNDIIILTFTPLIIYFSRNAKINPFPYLFGILTASNTWSIMLLIGNPTNIYIGTSVGIDFLSYFKVMYLPGLVAGFSGFIMISLIFRKELNKKLDTSGFGVVVKDRFLLIVGVVHLLVTIILMAISNYIKLEMYLITLIMGLSLSVIALIYLLLKKLPIIPLKETYKKAPWSFVPMILGMFVLINGLSNSGVTSRIAQLLNSFDPIFGYGLSSHLVSNLTNNQPMSMLYAEILQSQVMSNDLLLKAYASIIGSNTGVLLTPFGALAGLMWFEMMKKFNIELSIVNYIKTMFIVGTVVLVLSLLALGLVL